MSFDRVEAPEPRPTRDESGAVTAELAMVLPVLVIVSIALAWLVSIGVVDARVVDAARETARSLSRGEDEATSVALGLRVAPSGARIRVDRRGDLVTVTVSATPRGPGGILDRLPAAVVRGRAVALMEPGS